MRMVSPSLGHPRPREKGEEGGERKEEKRRKGRKENRNFPGSPPSVTADRRCFYSVIRANLKKNDRDQGGRSERKEGTVEGKARKLERCVKAGLRSHRALHTLA
jgi:hypothetical protein